MRKKAQGLSLNTIIVAAIVLIVLIVLWAIFTGKMGGFTQGLGSTTESVEACNKRCTATGMYVKGIASSNACKERQMGKVRTSTGGEENCCCTTNAAATGTPTTKHLAQEEQRHNVTHLVMDLLINVQKVKKQLMLVMM